MNKNGLKWLGIAVALLLVFAFVMPLNVVASAKGFYLIGAGLVVLYFLYLGFKNAESISFMFNSEQRKSSPDLSKFKRFMLALLTVVCIGAIGGFSFMRITAALKKEGVHGVATVTAGEHRKSTSLKRGTQNTYKIDFKFKTSKGEEVEGSENISATEYGGIAVGSPIEIVYLPDHPNVLKLLMSDESKLEYTEKK